MLRKKVEEQIESFESHKPEESEKKQLPKMGRYHLLYTYLVNYAITTIHKDIWTVICYDPKFQEKELIKPSPHLPS